MINDILKSLKPERIQIFFQDLTGWVLEKEWNPETRQDEPVGIWTAFELADHLEACELVHELGVLADNWGSTPDVDVRDNYVFVSIGSSTRPMVIEDFDFAKAVDREIGDLQRAKALLTW